MSCEWLANSLIWTFLKHQVWIFLFISFFYHFFNQIYANFPEDCVVVSSLEVLVYWIICNKVGHNEVFVNHDKSVGMYEHLKNCKHKCVHMCIVNSLLVLITILLSVASHFNSLVPGRLQMNFSDF